MNKQPPSIFNDVIGPVMRGPSSSHTAASVRIGKMVRRFFNSSIISFKVEFDRSGSLASTYSSQGSDFGLAGGLLGMSLDAPELINSLEIARNKGIEISFSVVDYPAEHPNTYRIKAADQAGREYRFIFISTGGGMIELKEINGVSVSICGDFYETLLFMESDEKSVLDKYMDRLHKLFPGRDCCKIFRGDQVNLITIRTENELSPFIREMIGIFDHLSAVVDLPPVLPIASRDGIDLPFCTAEELLASAEEKELELWKLAVRYEMIRGGITSDEVLELGRNILKYMEGSIKEGLDGTQYSDRILGPQAANMLNYKGRLVGGEEFKKIIANITAVMETKSAMGIIVAAPTAGSCGVIPGTLIAIAEVMELGDDAVLKGLLAGAVIGLLIAHKSTFAAEECGCQAECGSASAMAAAGLVQMLEGTVKKSLDAAAIALQNIMGMVCDPVAERVEVPCLGKNVMAGFNAIASANMALAGYDNVIPLDETIEAFHQVGKMLPSELRCTGGAGLSVTNTAKKIAETLMEKKTES